MKHLVHGIFFCALTATSPLAATYSTTLSYSASQSLFGGANTFSLGTSGSENLGLGNRLDYDIGVDSGTVDASVRASFTADFSRSMDIADASNASFKLNLDAPSSGSGVAFQTSFGAGVEVNATLFDLATFSLIDEGARLNLSDNNNLLIARQNPFGDSISDTENDALIGVGPDNIFFELNATGNVEQTSTLDIDGFNGLLVAKHSSGVERVVSFDFTDMTTLNLDLSLEGTWNLSIIDAFVDNTFDSEFDFFVRGTAGLFGASVSLDTPRIGFADINPFALNFGTQSRNLGNITVTAPVVEPPVGAVPLPAGVPLLLAGLGGLVMLRRRKTEAGAKSI